MREELQRVAQSLDEVFARAQELNSAFEKTEKPRQRAIVEILHKHNLPAFIAPFFDAYFRITIQGGDIEQISLLMIGRLSVYLEEDPKAVAQRHRAAVADYVEFMSRDLGESGKASYTEEILPANG